MIKPHIVPLTDRPAGWPLQYACGVRLATPREDCHPVLGFGADMTLAYKAWQANVWAEEGIFTKGSVYVAEPLPIFPPPQPRRMFWRLGEGK